MIPERLAFIDLETTGGNSLIDASPRICLGMDGKPRYAPEPELA